MDPATTAHTVRRRGRPTEAGRIERRGQILDAALPVFLGYGFGNATVDRIAAAARVTKRTIYSYFGNKDGLFTEMQRRLAANVSGEPLEPETLESLATRIVYGLHSAQMIGLHRLVIAESLRFPELARNLHDNGDMQHIRRLADQLRAEHSPAVATRAESLYALLLGEDYRRRLLGLLGPVTAAEATIHAQSALALICLTNSVEVGLPAITENDQCPRLSGGS